MDLRLICLILIAGGCSANSYLAVSRTDGQKPSVTRVTWMPDRPATVVILPPQRTDDPLERCYERIAPGAEEVLERLLETQLSAIQEIRVVARDRIEDLLGYLRSGIGAKRAPDKAEAIRVARFNRADYALFSQIDRCAPKAQVAATEYGDIRYNIAEVAFNLSLVEVRTGRTVFAASHAGDARQLLPEDSASFAVDPAHGTIRENDDGDRQRLEDAPALLQKLVEETLAEFPRPAATPPDSGESDCVVHFSGISGASQDRIKEMIARLLEQGEANTSLAPTQTETTLTFQLTCRRPDRLCEKIQQSCNDERIQATRHRLRPDLSVFDSPPTPKETSFPQGMRLAVLDFEENQGVPQGFGRELASALIAALSRHESGYTAVERRDLKPIIREALVAGDISDSDLVSWAASDRVLLGDVSFAAGAFTVYYRIVDHSGEILRATTVRAPEKDELVQAAVKSLYEDRSFPDLFVHTGRLAANNRAGLEELLLFLEKKNAVKIFSLRKSGHFLQVHLLLLEGNVFGLQREIEENMDGISSQALGTRHLMVFDGKR